MTDDYTLTTVPTERDIQELIVTIPSIYHAYTLRERHALTEVEFLRIAVVLLAAERNAYQAALKEMYKFSPLPPINMRDNAVFTPELLAELRQRITR